MASQMHTHEFYAHNSPWTEVYEMHCEREESQAQTPMHDTAQEVKPTHDALEDVYNRDDSADAY